MPDCSNPDIICGWVSGAGTRGTLSIVYSSFATIWLCTWTALCLNLTEERNNRGWRFLWYKFRWQLFAIFFPEVLVVTAAEQWVSARQSVREFAQMGITSDWSIRHAFFADMGGIMIAPRHSDDIFPVDAYQLAHLIREGHLQMPRIHPDDIRAVNKADGLARVVTLGQMVWFCASCLGRASQRLGISPLELETLAFILCTIHTFFFWYHKPLDPVRAILLPVDATIDQIGGPSRRHTSYERTPLDFIRPPPDPKSLVTPFWFGFKIVFDYPHRGHFGLSNAVSAIDGEQPTPTEAVKKPRVTVPNSVVTPAEGMDWPLTVYLLVFQLMYYALHIAVGWRISFPSHADLLVWEISNIIDLVLITVFVVGLALGSQFAPWIGRVMFERPEATTVLEVASLLPFWAKAVIHAPFVLGYIAARVVGLGEALVSLRALPTTVYQDINWSDFLPHV